MPRYQGLFAGGLLTLLWITGSPRLTAPPIWIRWNIHSSVLPLTAVQINLGLSGSVTVPWNHELWTQISGFSLRKCCELSARSPSFEWYTQRARYCSNRAYQAALRGYDSLWLSLKCPRRSCT